MKAEAADVIPAATAAHDLKGLNIEKNHSGRIKITAKTHVADVKILDEVPKNWPTTPDTAFVIDFSDNDRAGMTTKAGRPKGLDAFLKAEVFHLSLS